MFTLKVELVALLGALGALVLVQCRSYNNGLIFYDLRTQIPYLPPTVSVSRGRGLASVKYSKKGSIWSTFGKPCDCSGATCGCCAGIKVKQYNFDQKMCANVTYMPGEQEALLDVSLNEQPSAKYGISTRNPSPFCIPVMMGIPMAMCVQMSNIAISGNNLNMCMDFVVRLATTDLFEMHFQCMKMGADGLQYIDKNGQPVLPPGGAKLPAGSEQNYDEYYDETTDSEYQTNDHSYNNVGENDIDADAAPDAAPDSDADADTDADNVVEEVYGDVEADVDGDVDADGGPITEESVAAAGEEIDAEEMMGHQLPLQQQKQHEHELETESELSTTPMTTAELEADSQAESTAGTEVVAAAATANGVDGDNGADDAATASYGAHNGVIDVITQTTTSQSIVVADITTTTPSVPHDDDGDDDDAASAAAPTTPPAAAAPAAMLGGLVDDAGYGHGASISLNLSGNAVDSDDAAPGVEETDEVAATAGGANSPNVGVAENTGSVVVGEQQPQQPQKVPTTVTEVVNFVAETMAEAVAEADAKAESEAAAQLTAAGTIRAPGPPATATAEAATPASASAPAADLITFYRRAYG